MTPTATASTSVRAQVITELVTMEPRLREQPLEDHVTMPDLALDSLKLVELGCRIEDSFGARIDFDSWVDHERAKAQGAFSLGSLVAFVEKATAR